MRESEPGRCRPTPALPALRGAKLPRVPLPAEIGCDLGQRVACGLLLPHWELERVVLVAGDHVQVKVEDGLPGRGLTAVQHVDAVAPETVPYPLGEPLGGRARGCQVALVHL